MRTMYVLALVSSLLAAGCSTTGTNCGGWANDGASMGCATGNCGTGNCGTGGCAPTDGASANFSDYNFDCGPMCGAHVSSAQANAPMGCDDCQVGAPLMSGYFSGAAANVRNRVASAKGRVAGGLCKGMGAMVGCFGCRDCGGGSAVGLNNSGVSGNIGSACTGRAGCGCKGCLSGLGSKFSPSRLFHPFGGQLPHTANNGGGGATGFGGGGSAPSYAYPYYTTRGPRDFLQDGCGPPPIYPSNPKPNCLPTIGG